MLWEAHKANNGIPIKNLTLVGTIQTNMENERSRLSAKYAQLRVDKTTNPAIKVLFPGMTPLPTDFKTVFAATDNQLSFENGGPVRNGKDYQWTEEMLKAYSKPDEGEFDTMEAVEAPESELVEV